MPERVSNSTAESRFVKSVMVVQLHRYPQVLPVGISGYRHHLPDSCTIICMNLLLSLLIAIIPANNITIQREPAVIQGTVTAYSEIDSCHYNGCLMSSGVKAFVGAIACPREIPLYTQIEIGGEKFICHDRTNKNLNGRWDIFVGYGKEAHQKALKLGIKTEEIKIY